MKDNEDLTCVAGELIERVWGGQERLVYGAVIPWGADKDRYYQNASDRPISRIIFSGYRRLSVTATPEPYTKHPLEDKFTIPLQKGGKC